MGTPEETNLSATTEAVEPDWKAEFEKAEKRRKDTQAAFTKSQQTLKALEAELAVRKTSNGTSLSNDELKQFEAIKYTDPEEWRNKVNALENTKRAELEARIEAEKSQVVHQTELERRAQVMASFNAANPGLVINDEVITFDVPSRITNKLKDGSVTFEDFLSEVKEYLTKPKVVKTEGVEQVPNLNTVGGATTPSKVSTQKDIVATYKNEVY